MTYSGTKEENFVYLGTYPSICAPIHPSMQVAGGAVAWGVGEGQGYASAGLNIK